jgi:oxygen-dependent protoporphyrinogen oxidase
LVEAPLGPKLVTTPLMTWRGKLRLLAEPFRDPKVANDGSVADFVRHRIGREGLDALLDPLVSGIHAGDPELLSMRACFPRLVELVQKHGGLFRALFATRGDPAPSVMKPDGGCQAVTDALATALGSKVITRAPVTALSFDGSLWHVISGAGNFDAERVVLALPCTTSARLLTTVAATLARAIGSVTSENVVSYTHAWRRENVGTRAPGFGYLVPSREKLQHLGTLFSSGIAPSSCPDGFVVFRTLLGGARHPELVDRDDAELAALVRREVAPLLDLRGEPVFTLVQRWRATLPRLDLQHPQRLAAIEQAVPPGLTLLGNWLRGIGVNHLVADAREHARKHALPTRA